jgi:hypothetical protein
LRVLLRWGLRFLRMGAVLPVMPSPVMWMKTHTQR